MVVEPEEPRVVLLTESRKPGETFSDTPVALVPGEPRRTRVLEDAIKEVATAAAVETRLPTCAALDLLARRVPRLRGGGGLPSGGSPIADVVAALLGMEDSYVGVQGPPGTGKSYLGSRVVKELVEQHHWRIGVVAQSHAVVENLLAGIVEAGLDPALVGKSNNDAESPTWTPITDTVARRAGFSQRACAHGLRPRGDGVDLRAREADRAWRPRPPRHRRGGPVCPGTDPGRVGGGEAAAPPRRPAAAAPGQPGHPRRAGRRVRTRLADGRPRHHPRGPRLLPGDVVPHAPPALREGVQALVRRAPDGRTCANHAERWMEDVAPGPEVVQVEHTGNRTESPEEAAEVVALVEAHLGRAWHDKGDGAARPLDQCDFLVVAPYNAQVALVRRHLDEAGLGDVRVGTVDKFQGQQAPIAIVSMTASSHGDVPRGMGFLLNRNRVNVAVSRAQWKAVVVRSEALTSYMPNNAQGVLELGAFIGLCHP